MPVFLHPLLATVILIPPAKWGAIQIQAASRRKTGDTLVTVTFGVLGFVAIVWIWTAVVPRIFATPLLEVTVSTLLFLLSQYIYRRRLRNYFAAADLV